MLHAHPRAAIAIPLPKRIAKDTRRAIEAAVEQHLTAVDGLLALLDLFDGDADLEASEPLEPSLGSMLCVGAILAANPALGFDQRRWALGSNDDREDEHDGREHDARPEGMTAAQF
jgi:hypothetical protein